MSLAEFIRGLAKKHPELKLKLKKANSNLTSFQYIYQTLSITIFSIIALSIIAYLIFKNDLFTLLIAELVVFCSFPLVYTFWLKTVDIQINKLGRDLDSDILFVSEYFLVSLESGVPLGNAIENLSKLNRPGGIFFKRIYTEFKTGMSFEDALEEGSRFAPSTSLKILIKRLKDSMVIGVDLKIVLENFIEESSEKKLIEAKSFSKKLNPIVMMYLLMGIVLPSLGITFFILGAAMLEVTPLLLKYILIFVFLLMFAFQYFAYTIFKFNKSVI
ncbi:MAG: type II secretion system F family protein [Nanoarchaeota archaeon]